MVTPEGRESQNATPLVIIRRKALYHAGGYVPKIGGGHFTFGGWVVYFSHAEHYRMIRKLNKKNSIAEKSYFH